MRSSDWMSDVCSSDLLDAQRSKQTAAQAQARRLQVGSGDRSQRIRTYNSAQGRITDHRVEGLTLYRLPAILEGDLDDLNDRLTQEHRSAERRAGKGRVSTCGSRWSPYQ